MLATRSIKSVLFVVLINCCVVLASSAGAFDVPVFDTTEDEARADALLRQLRAGDYESILALLAVEGDKEEIVAQLDKMKTFVPDEDPIGYETAGWNVFTMTSINEAEKTTTTIQLEYEFTDAWVLLTVVFVEQEENLKVTTFRVVQREESLRETYKVEWSEAGLIHYLFVALAISIPTFILTTVVICVRTKNVKRKWLWIIFILLGFTTYHFNWTTESVTNQWGQFQLLGVGTRGGGDFAPMVISISLPLGAALFLWRRRQAKEGSLIAIKSDNETSDGK